jgi:hypothetical protein
LVRIDPGDPRFILVQRGAPRKAKDPRGMRTNELFPTDPQVISIHVVCPHLFFKRINQSISWRFLWLMSR